MGRGIQATAPLMRGRRWAGDRLPGGPPDLWIRPSWKACPQMRATLFDRPAVVGMARDSPEGSRLRGHPWPGRRARPAGRSVDFPGGARKHGFPAWLHLQARLCGRCARNRGWPARGPGRPLAGLLEQGSRSARGVAPGPRGTGGQEPRVDRFLHDPESAAYRGIRPSIHLWPTHTRVWVGRARLRRQAHLCGAHVVSNYAPLLDARLPCIQTRLDALGSHARRRIQVEIS